MECIPFLAARVCSPLRTDVLNTACGGLRLVLYVYSHVKHSTHVQLHMALYVAVFFVVVFFTQSPGPDNRGPDNRGSTVYPVHILEYWHVDNFRSTIISSSMY